MVRVTAVAIVAPFLLFDLPRAYIRHRRMFAVALRPFTGQLVDLTYKLIHATLVIAQALPVA